MASSERPPGGVFHPGELAAQAKAGLRAEAERVGGIVRTSIPPAAAAFLTEQRMLVIGGADEQARVWSSQLTGPPGFLRAGVADGQDFVEVAARPLPSDPLALALTGRRRLGAIALDPGTRRRMRINGVSEPAGAGLRITVEQVYSNCPKYIQRRSPACEVGGQEPAVTVARALGPTHRALVTRADTFFIATVSGRGDYDASHRGGNPGFVHVHPDGTLSWPDYPGNALMMTLGNLEQNPAAGLLFPDWSTGTILQLSGTARVEWTDARRVRFAPAQVRSTRWASALRWSEPEYSRFNPP